MKKRILLVEDNAGARALLGRIFTHAGHEAVMCGSAEEALGYLLTRSRFDALVTDLRMPGMDGFDLLHHVSQLPTTHQPVKVVAISGMFGSEARRLLDDKVEFMQKPVDIAKLLRTIGGESN